MSSSSSSSSSSAKLLRTVTREGVRHLYRTILGQARLLANTLDDPIVLRSHRYLARKNLEPDEHLGATWPPSSPVKRILRAKVHRRQLADANQGWEHAVFRSLSLAYARSGKLRRDAMSELSPQPSQKDDELRYPRDLRARELSPILRAILMSTNSIRGSIVKDIAWFDRPPSDFLPGQDDPLVKLYGRAHSKKRITNATQKFHRTYLKKVLLPIDVVTLDRDGKPTSLFDESAGSNDGREPLGMWLHLESRARGTRAASLSKPRAPNMAETDASSRSTGSVKVRRSCAPGLADSAYLRAARRMASEFSSGITPSAHRKKSLRVHGWTCHPKDYSLWRTRRRIYARILDQTSLIVLPREAAHQFIRSDQSVKNDPLGIRAKLRLAVHYFANHTAYVTKIKILKSRYALSSARDKHKGERIPFGFYEGLSDHHAAIMSSGIPLAPTPAAPASGATRLDHTEIEFLRRSGLL
ncbi:hypothetical protein BCV70DRAFT_193630 [Testicularia cyperi]|uniref:LYR motif-containing protein Cup1-like N-terminal domain-containing protein n=1 Tax=Testicularia cyperi TaxID=1882483 RepID=A0A317XLN2_9BASI|nr:hypothetical protein BCV70DRAFT_193630 [Testicularia cyperi]